MNGGGGINNYNLSTPNLTNFYDPQPAMSPRVFDEAGNELYGSAYVEQEFVLKHGMAGYVKDLEQAETNDRVAGNPLTVRAVGVAGKNKTDIILVLPVIVSSILS